MLNLKRNGSAIELVFPFLFFSYFTTLIYTGSSDRYFYKKHRLPIISRKTSPIPFVHHDYIFRPSRLYLSFITTIPFALIFHYRTKKEVNTNYRYLPPNSLYI